MSLQGYAYSDHKLQGSISKISVVHTDTYQLAVQNGYEGTLEEWLDSLTVEKAIPVYSNTEEMTESFKKSDAFCYVLLDDSYFCRGYKGNYYRFEETSKPGAITLTNGGYAELVIPAFQPVKSNTECIDHILNIAYSYSGKGIAYKSSNGPFANNTSYLAGMQCSQFANTILQGLMYENSRLATKTLSENVLLDGGCRWLDVPEYKAAENGCLAAAGLAQFAAAHGWLHQTSKFKNVQPGDLVFFAYTSATTYWNYVNHVAICIGRIGHKTLMMNFGSIGSAYDSTGADMKSSTTYYLASGDGLNFQTILNDDDDFVNGTTYKMFGFARFPLHYRNLSDAENDIIEKALGDT